MKDYYVVLGVPRNENLRGIREAYRQLAKRYHPDRAGQEGSTAFRDLVEAYAALSDLEQRSRLDRSLQRAEGRLDIAPDTIVFDDDLPPEPLAPAPVSLMRGFSRVRPSREEIPRSRPQQPAHDTRTQRRADRGARRGAGAIRRGAGSRRRGAARRPRFPDVPGLCWRARRTLGVPLLHLRRPRRGRGRGPPPGLDFAGERRTASYSRCHCTR